MKQKQTTPAEETEDKRRMRRPTGTHPTQSPPMANPPMA